MLLLCYAWTESRTDLEKGEISFSWLIEFFFREISKYVLREGNKLKENRHFANGNEVQIDWLGMERAICRAIVSRMKRDSKNDIRVRV